MVYGVSGSLEFFGTGHLGTKITQKAKVGVEKNPSSSELRGIRETDTGFGKYLDFKGLNSINFGTGTITPYAAFRLVASVGAFFENIPSLLNNYGQQ